MSMAARCRSLIIRYYVIVRRRDEHGGASNESVPTVGTAVLGASGTLISYFLLIVYASQPDVYSPVARLLVFFGVIVAALA